MSGFYQVLQYIAVILSILYTLWTLYHDPKVRKQALDFLERVWPSRGVDATASSSTAHWRNLPFPFHFRRETINIVLGGLLLNFLGYAVSFSLNKSVLYLDMTGTALVAFLLGPWWGALTGLLSNSLINYLLYPAQEPEFAIFPWSLVNMAGGLYWGWLGGKKRFQKYLHPSKVGLFKQIWYLAIFGVVGAAIMSLPGAIVQEALPPAPGFGEDQELLLAIDGFLITYDDILHSLSEVGIVGWLGRNTAFWAHLLLKTWFRYIPDKTMSVAIAVMALRYGFPLYEKVLLHTKRTHQRPRDNWTGPTLLGLCYIPCFLTFLLHPENKFHFDQFWLLWSCPLLFAVYGMVTLGLWGPSAPEVRAALDERVAGYGLMTELAGEPAYGLHKLFVGTLAASLFFVSGLLFLEVDRLRFAFNFQSLVLGFLLALHLVRLSICQNLAIRIQERERTAVAIPQEYTGVNAKS